MSDLYSCIFFFFCLFCPDDNFEFGGMGPDGDEEEEDEEIDQLELQRRKERLEKEQWLRERVCVRKKNAMYYACVHVSDLDPVL